MKMSKQLCAVCNGIFSGNKRLNKEQPHHRTPQGFLNAANTGCYICRTIVTSSEWGRLASQDAFDAVWHLSNPAGSPAGFSRLTIDTIGEDEGSANPQSDDEATDNDDDGKDGKTSKKAAESSQGDSLAIPAAWAFHIQVAKDIEPNVGDYRPSTNIEDGSLKALARTWFNECCKDHSCGPRDPNSRPTRLVKIIDKDKVRIVLTQEHTKIDSYAALSHCWGKSKTLKLLQNNITELRSEFPVTDLPLSYQEAIAMCVALGIEYIWIDSICIIQDSTEDWRREAATMGEVYSNSVLNICTGAAADSWEPSFTERDCFLISPLEIVPSWDGESNERLYLSDAEIYQKDIEDSPLRKRAWVLQEVWLSRRSLSLTKSQLWWECCEGRACESFPGGVPASWMSRDLIKRFSFRQRPDETDENTAPDTLGELHRSWSKLVEIYSSCGLTYMVDKLMAFSGIAQGFKQTDNPNDEYVAGLWRKLLPASLCWTTMDPDRTHRPELYRAPSWSWASLQGSVGFFTNIDLEVNGELDMELLCSVVSINLQLVDETHETGLLKGGAMEINGRLIRPITMEAPGTLQCGQKSDPELQDALRACRWDFDEVDGDGENALTYLDGFDFIRCREGHLDGATRKTYTWDGPAQIEVSCLPVYQSAHGDEGEMCMRGLILLRVDNQPRDVFHRVGDFSFMPVLKNGMRDIPEQTFTIL